MKMTALKNSKAKWILAGAVFMVSILTVICIAPKTEVAPDYVLGVWKTSQLKYHDRFFEITAATLTFGTGSGNQEIFSIDSVDKVDLKNKTAFTIRYSDAQGTEFNLTFHYAPENGGVSRFKNQQHIEWTRTDKAKA